tara:strand:+ start:61 stop:612 length:552 start_codon:yes stop_codon:yes gene_type:complete
MSIKKALDIFGTSVIDGSKKELARKKKNASGDLGKSLDYNLKVSKNSFQLDFLMEDYGKFIDKGVKGIGGERKEANAKGEKKYKLKKVTNNLYKYKKGIQNKPSSKHFNSWTVRRGIAPRSKGGQFTSRKGLMEAISQAVWHQGLETTHFFTNPFEKAFKELPPKVVEAYALEVDRLLKLAIE